MSKLDMIARNIFQNKTEMSEEQIQCATYTLKAIWNEISKFLMFAVFFALQGQLYPFVIFYFSFVSIRLFAGGIHCHTYWQCVGVSLIFICCGIYIPVLLDIRVGILLGLAIVSCLFPALFSPMTPSVRIVKSQKQRVFLKIGAVVLSVVYTLVALLCMQKEQQCVVLMAICLANYQLIIPGTYTILKKRR